MKDIPDTVSFINLPVKPTVEPIKVYDLDEFQYAEPGPEANSNIISGYGAQNIGDGQIRELTDKYASTNAGDETG